MAVGQVRPPGLARPIAKESHFPVDRPGHPWPGRFALLTRQPMRRDSLIAVKCVAQWEHEGVMQGSKAWRRNSLIAVKCVAQCEHEGGNGGLRSKASAAWLARCCSCQSPDEAGGKGWRSWGSKASEPGMARPCCMDAGFLCDQMRHL
ncbi:hypothetical protein S7A_04870 [Pantoea sp. Sc1]|nr:hypothetical protein S7A_04870 [Pantoea sp. Sc1]